LTDRRCTIGVSGIKQRELTGREDIDKPYTSTAGDAVGKNIYALFCKV
jgi:hypothetical protein